MKVRICGDDGSRMMCERYTGDQDIECVHPVPRSCHPGTDATGNIRGRKIEIQDLHIGKKVPEKLLLLWGFHPLDTCHDLIVGYHRHRSLLALRYGAGKGPVPEVIDQERGVKDDHILALPELRIFFVKLCSSSSTFESRSAPAYSRMSRFFLLMRRSMTSEKLSSPSLRTSSE